MLPNSTERAVTISGSSEAVTQCVYHICCVMSEVRNKKSTHDSFFCNLECLKIAILTQFKVNMIQFLNRSLSLKQTLFIRELRDPK